MPKSTMPAFPFTGISSAPSEQNSLDIVLQRVNALEAKVGRLELQVVRLQNQLHERSKQIRTRSWEQYKEYKATKAQTTKSPLKASTKLQNSKLQSVSKQPSQISPSKRADQQQSNNPLIKLSPIKDNMNLNLVSSVAYMPANIASSSAFVKVSGAMGSCQVGTISDSVHHIAALQLDIDAQEGALWISSTLKNGSTKRSSIATLTADLSILEMGVVFRSAQILASSLDFGRVVDTLLLPAAILDQLQDPNEVPANLYYITWKYHGCGADGFEQFEKIPAEFDQKDRIMGIYRQVLGHRQTVQVWFTTDDERIDRVLACLKERCCREATRDWHPCPGHGGEYAELCTNMGSEFRRRGVLQFLQQSAPS
ncbi:hypothetical protein MMC16_004182 [Acarospora aff. strigata]|nr:hypothetical protein [Acarospora aff. strigata]